MALGFQIGLLQIAPGELPLHPSHAVVPCPAGIDTAKGAQMGALCLEGILLPTY